MPRRSRPAMVVAAFSFVIACTTDDPSVPSDPRIDAFARDYCDLTAGVCCPPIGATNAGGGCRQFVGNAAERPGTAFDQDAADRCLGGLRASRGAPSFCVDFGGGDTAASCHVVFRPPTDGTIAPGALCANEAECAPSADGEVACVQRHCQLRVHAKEGEPCRGDRVHVRFGFATVLDANAANALEPRENVCWESDGLYCALATKTCTKQAPPGGACTIEELSPCIPTAHCDESSKKCTDGVLPARISLYCIQ